MIAKIQDYLLADGISANVLGFGYLTKAIELYHPGMAMTKEIYPAIAEAYGTTPCGVEKAIRHAIIKTGRQVVSSPFTRQISNAEYISYVKLMVSRQCDGEAAI